MERSAAVEARRHLHPAQAHGAEERGPRAGQRGGAPEDHGRGERARGEVRGRGDDELQGAGRAHALLEHPRGRAWRGSHAHHVRGRGGRARGDPPDVPRGPALPPRGAAVGQDLLPAAVDAAGAVPGHERHRLRGPQRVSVRHGRRRAPRALLPQRPRRVRPTLRPAHPRPGLEAQLHGDEGRAGAQRAVPMRLRKRWRWRSVACCVM
mmetsp:Transcript_5967/g.16702  ORF Transcript_5967/g.16702 Transcript_5967/m.16702 type:complete len:208 (-) Transcript_5967:182-805(-)